VSRQFTPASFSLSWMPFYVSVGIGNFIIIKFPGSIEFYGQIYNLYRVNVLAASESTA